MEMKIQNKQHNACFSKRNSRADCSEMNAKINETKKKKLRNKINKSKTMERKRCAHYPIWKMSTEHNVQS